jgi:hypothetical protein
LRLALALGRFPGEIDAMPYADYLEFQEFYDIEPWGLAVDDSMNAHAISVLANVNRDSKTRPKAYTIKDFLLYPPKTDSSTPAVEPTVEGKTASQWKLIFAAEALAAQQKNKEAPA